MTLFNQYSRMPYIPYNAIVALANNNENIFKILKYNTYDCISQPNLSYDEKLDMVWNNQTNEEDYRIFLKPLVSNEIPEAITQMRMFKVDMNPLNNITSTICYEFDFICGDKIALIDYNGVPCNRIDVLETELLQTLNGRSDLGSIGAFQFNSGMSRLSRGSYSFNNGKSYFGSKIIFTMQTITLDEGGCQQ